MTTAIHSITSKIVDYLLMAHADNLNQAAAALRLAKAELQNYQSHNVGHNTAKFRERKIGINTNGTGTDYEIELASVIAKGLNCEVIASIRTKHSASLHLRGLAPRPDMARQTFGILRRVFNRDRKQYLADLWRSTPGPLTRQNDEYSRTWINKMLPPLANVAKHFHLNATNPHQTEQGGDTAEPKPRDVKERQAKDYNAWFISQLAAKKDNNT
ncbi:MAG: hypothetical protein HOO93_10390 [Methyloglobulus sp.]|nr:hypothetical protein [Methyloglobulus sp.]